MKVVKVKKVEDCYESSNARDIILSSQITKDFAKHLGKFGKLLLFDEFGISYFKLIVKGKYTVKGAFGKTILRVILPEEDVDISIDDLVKHIESYKGKEKNNDT